MKKTRIEALASHLGLPVEYMTKLEKVLDKKTFIRVVKMLNNGIFPHEVANPQHKTPKI